MSVPAHDSKMNTQPNVKPTKSVAARFLATLVMTLSLILVIDLPGQSRVYKIKICKLRNL